MATSPEAMTPEESALINKYLKFYTALADGWRQPTTPAQEHFIAVCKGTAPPESTHEVAFLKFLEQRAAEQELALLACEVAAHTVVREQQTVEQQQTVLKCDAARQEAEAERRQTAFEHRLEYDARESNSLREWDFD